MENENLPPAGRFRIHRHRAVKLHRSGRWTICIGKALNRAGTKLRRKDWYFKGTEADANKAAADIQRKWEFLVKNWRQLYGATLEVCGSPFAGIPHWQTDRMGVIKGRKDPTAAEIEEFHNQRPTAEDMIDAYAEVRLAGVYSLFEQEQKLKVAHGDIQQASFCALTKSLRSAIRYFPPDVLLKDLTESHVKQAKTEMHKKLKRRTVRNRLVDLRRMLLWFYDSQYGQGFDRFVGFNGAFTVRNAVRTNVDIYGPEQIRNILAAATDRERLYIMLALNCGMYQADIGRLRLDEVEQDNGAIFWDREKEPENPFRVRHELWEETRRLVDKFLQPRGTVERFSTDWRSGSAVNINCSSLAFVDAEGHMIYRIGESGRAYDKISKAMARLNKRLAKSGKPSFKFQSLRKSTNQLLCEHLAEMGDGDNVIAIGEISTLFLAQKGTLLTRLYRSGSAARLFAPMNRHLKAVGEKLRKANAFEALCNLNQATARPPV